jgi:hypothetical protein
LDKSYTAAAYNIVAACEQDNAMVREVPIGASSSAEIAREPHMRTTFITLTITPLTSAVPASATTMAFSDLLTSSAFTTYTESGFTVSPTFGSWEAVASFGNPAPFIWFNRAADESEINAQIEVNWQLLRLHDEVL